MSVVDTAGFPVVTVPRHAMPPLRQCTTPECTNEGPLATAIAAPDSGDRCRACVEAVTFWLDPVVAGGNRETIDQVRREVMSLPVQHLRPYRWVPE